MENGPWQHWRWRGGQEIVAPDAKPQAALVVEVEGEEVVGPGLISQFNPDRVGFRYLAGSPVALGRRHVHGPAKGATATRYQPPARLRPASGSSWTVLSA